MVGVGGVVGRAGYFVFAIYSATARENEYLLQASSLTEMEDWVVALVLAGANPGKDRYAAPHSPHAHDRTRRTRTRRAHASSLTFVAPPPPGRRRCARRGRSTRRGWTISPRYLALFALALLAQPLTRHDTHRDTHRDTTRTATQNDKNGWMEKKGRKRWFVLRNSHLYWYKAVQEVRHDTA